MHFPLQIKNISGKFDRKPWITPGLLASIRTKRKLYRKFLKNPLRFGNEYRRHKNLLTTLTRTAREQYYHNLLQQSSGNSKKIWTNINSILGKKHKSNNSSIKINGQINNEPNVIASTFNSYFNNVLISLSNNIPDRGATFETFMHQQIPESPNFNTTSIDEVKNIIKELKNSTSFGWDNIPTNIIKIAIHAIAPILTILINKSLSQSIFPNSLKRAKISPIFKSKDKLDVKNYRPISVLPIFSKIYEKVFYNRLYNYFSTNNLFSPSQFGFRQGTSTEHALLKFTDDVLQAFDNKKITVATFMDLSKAFDCVNHNILLSKLDTYGVPRSAIAWIKSYLTDREHFVIWNQTESPTLKLNIGVPQGSILGPLLFLVYVNDLANTSKDLSFVLFADDTTVYISKSSVNEAVTAINAELIPIVNWFDANKLTLNIDKTQLMILSRKHEKKSDHPVLLRGQPIAQISEAKFLGVIVDQHLNWKSHITMVAQKLSKSCGLIYRIRKNLNLESKILIYYSLIQPYLTYCINVWSSTYKTNLRSVTIAQKRAMRALFTTQTHSHSIDMFIAHKILPLPQMIEFHETILAYKVINNQFVLDNFLILPINQAHDLRNNDDLRIPRVTSSHTKLFIKTRATNSWNALPNDIRTSTSLQSFKRQQKEKIIRLLTIPAT